MSLYQSRIGSNQAGDFTTTDVAAFIKYTKQIKEHCVYLDLPVMTIEEALEEYSESSNSVINLNVSYNGSRQQHYLSQVHNVVKVFLVLKMMLILVSVTIKRIKTAMVIKDCYRSVDHLSSS